MKIINIYLIFVNIISFSYMAIDKIKAIKRKKRISEQTLITLCIIGGSIGTISAMIILKHKIRKPKFLILVQLLLIVLIYLHKKIPLI